ncbi:DNA binding domain-containing protein, excisionase family [Roseovarius lutimaris]|uniref:DNA binding domain-containing protein, excisionase family n=1 Tax=Roseovarius lutimaris TaxID=1005928 RepID=A0A1I5ASB1_9RHOB|nr:helix-turn-helix transcriptional regulator [Roseovarius lutimaris]SFN65280.1 DNA binding domain-containing protein, excisionase family [Roseovarius lutimaris]
MDSQQPAYLTTKEVADLLRVKERKVYDLVAAEEIPHRKITGKLLFPTAELTAWIEGSGAASGALRPAVVTGSHDPLLDWALRECGAGLATLLNGSRDGLVCFAQGQAAVAGLHIPDAEGWNIAAVEAAGLGNCVLIGWAERARGLILSEATAKEVRGIGDLRGKRVILRQPGAGAAALFQRLLAEAGLGETDILAQAALAHTESDAAAAVAAGEAEATLGIKAMAQQFHLPFVPLVDERFDLLIDRRSYFTEPVQSLLRFARSGAFAAKAGALGGYDIGDLGQVRWISK